MITYLLGMIVKSLFDAVLALLVGIPPTYNGLFGSIWITLSSKVSSALALDGAAVGLGFYDTFVGIDFTAWALGLAVTVIITIRLIRLIMGLFSKA
jgi:hypothetical protein